jgi:hypothetical protein
LRGNEVNWSLLTALVILRIEQPDIYADIARLPELLIALQRVYSGTWKLDSSTDFIKDFGEKAPFVRERCATYYQPATTLAAVFALNFWEARDRLQQYVSLGAGT